MSMLKQIKQCCEYFTIIKLLPHHKGDNDYECWSPPGVDRISDEPQSSLVVPLEHDAIASHLAERPPDVVTHSVQPEEGDQEGVVDHEAAELAHQRILNYESNLRRVVYQ